MDAALSGYLFQPSVIAQLLAGVAGFAAAGSAAAMAVPRIAERLIPRPKQTRLADHMKFVEMHDDHHTVICEDGIFAVVLQLQGTDLKFNDSGRQQALNVQRQRWIEQMNEDGIRIREFFVRDRLPKASEFPHKHGIMEHIAHAWADGLPRPLSTEFFVVMSVKDAKNGVARLNDAIGQTVSILEEYRVKPLVDEEVVPASMHDENGNYVPPSLTLTPAAFFARMLSPISRPTPIGDGRGIPLSHRMCADVMSYENDLGMIQFKNGPDNKYAAIFVIEEWSSPMYETHMLELLAFPLEMTIVHDIEPIGKAKGMATIGYQMKIAPGLQPGTNAVEQFASVAQQIERGASDEQELARVQTMIIVYGDTPEEVRRGYSKITQLKTFGITPVWARHTAVSHWFGQFPGYDALNRPQRLLSGEVSIISTFQNTPVGQIRSDWGEGPIAMFETLDGAPYSFQWHVGAGSPPLGHAVVIGPAGQGKTTLITFLAAMSLRHESLKAFFFDRGRGCEIITRALKGSYLFFDGEEKSVALNPMQLDDNGPNRLFLRDWLQMIGGVDEKEYVLAQEIADAVEINFDQNLPVEHRNLQKLYNSAFPSHSDLRQRLMAWTNPNQFGSIVCAPRDTLDITQRVGGFDFTHILDDERLGPPMVSYLMHRIQSEAKGDPRLIFIDETEPLLRNENFRRRFNEMLQEGRKKRQVVISCFQRPQAPEDVGVGDVVRGQCPTVFFFRNFQAKAEDYKDWNLTARELDFVLGNTYKKNKYSVLVKRYGDNPESVLLNVDLSTLGKYMKVFHSGHVQVHRVNALREKHGEEHYLEHYLAA